MKPDGNSGAGQVIAITSLIPRTDLDKSEPGIRPERCIGNGAGEGVRGACAVETVGAYLHATQHHDSPTTRIAGRGFYSPLRIRAWRT